jgi:microsomal epoxide hydrolase
MSYDAIPKGASLKPEKFTLQVPEEEVKSFRQLLSLSPLAPKTYENLQTDPNLYGVSHEWMSKAKEHWASKYDWHVILGSKKLLT